MNSRTKGILCIIFSSFSFALMNVCVRAAGDLPSIEKSFFRNLVAAVVAFIILKQKKTPMKMGKGNTGYMLIRSICGTLGILFNFYAVDHLVLSDASMLNKMSPFFVIVFSYLILKERLNLIQILAVAGAFAGSLLVIKPTFANMQLVPSMIGLAGGLCAGIAYTMVRVLGQRGVESSFIVFFFSTFSCLVTVPYLIFAYEPMTLRQLLILLGAGIAATGGQFGITKAYFYAPAKEISIYDYSQIIFAALFGLILFGQGPDVLSILGYLVICGMALMMFLYNRKQSEIEKG